MGKQTKAQLASSQKYKHTKKGRIAKQKDEKKNGSKRALKYLHTEKGWQKQKKRVAKYRDERFKNYKPNVERFVFQNKVLEILDSYLGEIGSKEHTFFDLRDNITNRVLRIDGFYSLKKIIVEVNGAQHYFPVRFGGISLKRAEENLKKYQRRDRIRQKFCLNKGYKLIIIPFTVKLNNVVDFVEKQINENNSGIIGKEFNFCYAHRLENKTLTKEENQYIFGKCNNFFGHGHNAKLLIEVKGIIDPLTGMIINFVDLKKIINPLIEKYDHKNLNQDFEIFKGLNITTCENFVVEFWKELSIELPNLYKITMWETPTSRFSITQKDII